MPKEKILQILSKYGMNLTSCAPYFYEHDGQIGLVYQFSHIHYGFLTRVFKVYNEEQLEEFAYQYWWFQKYAKTYGVKIELDNYQDIFAIPHFIHMNKKINSKEMKELLIQPEILIDKLKTTQTFQKLLRTVNILIEIISLKTKMIRDTYQNVNELQDELYKKKNEFIELYNQYQKEEKTIEYVKKPEKYNFDEKGENDYFSKLSLIQEKEDVEALKKFIEDLWVTLKEMESNDYYIKYRYLLTLIPLRLEDVSKMKNYLENLLNKKKGIFSKKEDPDIELRIIEKQSNVNHITTENDFIAHEKERLEDKYAIISQLDYETLGDYLNDFDNMGVFMPQENCDNVDYEMNHDDFVKKMVEIEHKLTDHEVQCLAVYHSFLEPLCDIVLEQILSNVIDDDIISLLLKNYREEVVEAMLHLGDGENVFIRMQKMRLIDLSSSEAFLRSIILVCKTIRMMKKFSVSGEITVFGQSIKEDLGVSLYHGNFKTVGAPIQKNNANIHDIIKIDQHIPFIYFSKCYTFRDPFFHDYALQEDLRDDVLLILKDYQVNWENSAIIKVSRFVINEQNGKDVITFTLEKIEEFRYLSVSF